MVKINLITVGKLKEKYLREGILEYSKRLSRFCDLNIIEVSDEQASESLSTAQELQVMKKEAERILGRYKHGTCVIALDLKGTKADSEGFASKLQGFFNSGISNITFVIGGTLGLDESLVRQADFRLSLSDMTFPHQ